MSHAKTIARPTFGDHVIILHATPYGESDLILTLLGEKTGRFNAFVRGAKNSQKRFGTGLEAGAQALATSTPPGANSDLWHLKDLSQINHWPWMAAEEKRLEVKLCGTYLLDLLKCFTPSAAPDSTLFALAMLAMAHLHTAPSVWEFACRFQVRLLQIHGICPDFATCNHCQRALTSGPIWPFGTGIVGPCCQPFLPLEAQNCCSETERLALALLLKGSKPPKEALGLGALRITRELLSSHFQRQVKSAAIFEALCAHSPTQQKAQ